jgi:hypothetical protein
MPKTADYLYAFRGTFDREPHGVCWVRVFEEASQTPVIEMGELPQNTSTVEERSSEGRLGRKPTWDRLTFPSWAPRCVWLSGQERLAFGDPHWEHLPEHEVEALLGREEMQALPPQVPIANGQA